MKTLKSIKYVLFSFIILGCFANFAQNEYGFRIVYWALMALLFTFLFETVYFGLHEKKAVSKERQFLNFILPAAIIGILTGISLLFYSTFGNGGKTTVFIGFIIMIFSIFGFVFLIGNKKPMFMESISFFLYCLSFLFKFNHYPGASIVLVLATVLLICYFVSNSILFFRNEKSQNIQAAWFFLILFLFIILNLSGTLFKTLHWPGGNFLGYLAVLVLIFIGISIVLRKQFSYSTGKTGLLKLIGNIQGNFSLIFIFYTLASIYFVLSSSGIVPRFYSNARPAAMIRLLEDDNESAARFDKYYNAYYNFLDNRKAYENRDK